MVHLSPTVGNCCKYSINGLRREITNLANDARCNAVKVLLENRLYHMQGQYPEKVWQLRTGIKKDADVENGLEDTGRGKGKLGRSERVAWTYIHYQM